MGQNHHYQAALERYYALSGSRALQQRSADPASFHLHKMLVLERGALRKVEDHERKLQRGARLLPTDAEYLTLQRERKCFEVRSLQQRIVDILLELRWVAACGRTHVQHGQRSELRHLQRTSQRCKNRLKSAVETLHEWMQTPGGLGQVDWSTADLNASVMAATLSCPWMPTDQADPTQLERATLLLEKANRIREEAALLAREENDAKEFFRLYMLACGERVAVLTAAMQAIDSLHGSWCVGDAPQRLQRICQEHDLPGTLGDPREVSSVIAGMLHQLQRSHANFQRIKDEADRLWQQRAEPPANTPDVNEGEGRIDGYSSDSFSEGGNSAAVEEEFYDALSDFDDTPAD